MKSIKLALMAGAAIAVSAAAAQADDLDALKAQIEALNARVAAMEAAPSVPAGYSLLTMSTGELQQTPGLEMTAKERAAYGNRAHTISVLPTADAPAGATISWSGYARAGLRYRNTELDGHVTVTNSGGYSWSEDFPGISSDDYDVLARGQLRVKASTDTAVGEVGVDLRLRADFDGVENESGDYWDIAWGYWAMTPELTFGGGYAGSLGDAGYDFDSTCTCAYIDTMAFDPGDTTQMRLTYASGPFSVAVAIEDATIPSSFDGGLGLGDIYTDATDDRLGVAGKIKYTGDTFGAELAGVWRDIDQNEIEDNYGPEAADFIGSESWQVSAGVQFGLADMASIAFAAALGEGPSALDDNSSGEDPINIPWRNSWWGVSGIVNVGLSDEVHAELGAGYRERDFNNVEFEGDVVSADSTQWIVGGGLYYNPVEQLTVGLEASYSSWNIEAGVNDTYSPAGLNADLDLTRTTVDLVSVWRF